MNHYDVLERTIAYIEENLHNDIGVEDVALHIGYSHYHLTRLFLGALGESLSNYMKKRKMAGAANDLVHTDKKVIDIGLEVGFQSSEAFSRSFKMIYGISPANYRKNKQDLFIGSKKRSEPELIRHMGSHVTIKPQIVTFDQVTIAGLSENVTLKSHSLSDLWEQFRGIENQIPDVLTDQNYYGVCDTNLPVFDKDGDIRFRYIAGIGVRGYDRLPEGFVKKTLRSGRYAVFTHRGSLAKISQTYDYIWGTWLLSTRETLDSREDFELYGQGFLGFDHPNTEVDIYIPIG